MLIHLLYEESQSVNVQIHLVKENKLSQHEQSKYCKAQQAIFDIWDDYIMGNESANHLLLNMNYVKLLKIFYIFCGFFLSPLLTSEPPVHKSPPVTVAAIV